MRRKKAAVPPSIRDAIAISKLLVIRFIRKGILIPDDFIFIATTCSPPENKEIAKEVAMNILLRRKSRAVKKKDEREVIDALSFIKEELQLAEAMSDPKINAAAEFYEQISRNVDPKIWKILKTVGGSEAVFKAGVSSMDELYEFTRNVLEERIGALSPFEAQLAKDLGINLSKSPRIWERSLVEDISEQIPYLDPESLSKVIQYSGNTPERESELLRMISTPQDLFFYAIATGKVPPYETIDKVIKFDFEKEFKIMERITEITGESLYLYYLSKLDTVPLIPLLQHPVHDPLWYDLVERSSDALLKKIKRNFPMLQYYVNSFYRILESTTIPQAQIEIKELIDIFTNYLIKAARTKHEFMSSAIFARKINVYVPQKTLEQLSKKFKLNDLEASKILSPNFAKLLSMITRKAGKYMTAKELIRFTKLTESNIEKLILASLKSEAYEWLAALFYEFPEDVLYEINSEEDMEKLRQAIERIANRDIISLWFKFREESPDWLKVHLRKIAKQILIRIASSFSYDYFGGKFHGNTPINMYRPYEWGDDVSLIDIDETLENILMQGKPIDDIKRDDLMVVETIHTRRSIIVILDISGSMDGEPLANMAISAAILMYAIPSKQIALSFFNDELFIIKNFDESIEIEEIVDVLLSMDANGGTSIGAAVPWIKESAKATNDVEKLLILLSDCYFNDDVEAIDSLIGYITKSIVIVPPDYNMLYSEYVAKRLNGYNLKIKDWEELPDKISKVLV